MSANNIHTFGPILMAANRKIRALMLILLIFGLWLSFGSDLIAAPTLLKLIQPRPERLILGFDSIPSAIKQNTSSDKKLLTLSFNANTALKTADKKYQGQVQSIQSTANQASLDVSIAFREARDYSLINLPYSNAVMIDIFRWNKLTRTENKYRTCLKKIDGDVPNSVKAILNDLALADHPDAAAVLGLISLRSNDHKTALSRFILAYRNGSAIPDVYAGLAQLFAIYKIPARSLKFIDIFSKSGVQTSFRAIPAYEQNTASDTIGLFDLLHDKIFDDSTNAKPKDTIATAPAMAVQTAKADSIKPKQAEEQSIVIETIQSILPPWFFPVALFFLVLLIILVVIIARRNNKSAESTAEEISEIIPELEPISVLSEIDSIEPELKSAGESDTKDSVQHIIMAEEIIPGNDQPDIIISDELLSTETTPEPSANETEALSDAVDQVTDIPAPENEKGTSAIESEPEIPAEIKPETENSSAKPEIPQKKQELISDLVIPSGVSQLLELAKKSGKEDPDTEGKSNLEGEDSVSSI